MSLNDICRATNLHKMTLHEHLNRLNEAGFIIRIEREGHKWVYYKLSWKGESLLHPENTHIVLLFSSTFVVLFFGIVTLVNFIREQAPTTEIEPGLLGAPPSIPADIPYLTIGFFVVFIILSCISFWWYSKNRMARL